MKKHIKVLKEEIAGLESELNMNGPKKFDATVLISDGRGPHVPFSYEVNGIEAMTSDEAYHKAAETAMRMHKYEGPKVSFNPKVIDVDVRDEGEPNEPTEAELDRYYNHY